MKYFWKNKKFVGLHWHVFIITLKNVRSLPYIICKYILQVRGGGLSSPFCNKEVGKIFPSLRKSSFLLKANFTKTEQSILGRLARKWKKSKWCVILFLLTRILFVDGTSIVLVARTFVRKLSLTSFVAFRWSFAKSLAAPFTHHTFVVSAR